MAQRKVNKTEGHYLAGDKVTFDDELNFVTTANPEIDSQGGGFLWRTITNVINSWRLRDDIAGDDILAVDTRTAVKTVTLHPSYTAIGFGGGTYFKTQIIMPSAPVAISASAANQAVTGLTYTIVTPGDYVFYAMVSADIANTDAKPFSITIYKNGIEETNSRFGDFAKKNEEQ